MSTQDVVMGAAALLGAGGLGAVATKWMGRGVDAATAENSRAQARATEVDTLRDIIAEVRDDAARKDQQLADVVRRVQALEERERHMLTRHAVHEAWDQLAFQAIMSSGSGVGFPPPPPLSLEE